jgi:hypothetical protein
VIESVLALASHVDLLAKALQREPGPGAVELANALVQRTNQMIDRLRPYAGPAQAEELDRLRLVLARAANSTVPTRAEAVELVRAGQALELDEAFARVAGVTPAEWAARVAARRPPAAAG